MADVVTAAEVGWVRRFDEALRSVAEVVPQSRERLLRYAEQIAAAPEGRRCAICAAVSIVEPALAHLWTVGTAASGPPRRRVLCPAYPKLPLRYAARLALGERPADLAPGLTSREAHEWCACGADDVVAWYLDRHGVERDVDPVSLDVAAWVVQRWRSPQQREALLRRREERIAGQVVAGAYVERLDELRKSDLRPSVEETFKRTARRLTAAVERSLQSKGEPLAPAPAWWAPSPFDPLAVRLLRSGRDLVAEGRAMRHCVGTYADVVGARKSVIVGLLVAGERSTAELAPETLEVRQHKARCNERPSAASRAVLGACVAIWKKRREKSCGPLWQW